MRLRFADLLITIIGKISYDPRFFFLTRGLICLFTEWEKKQTLEVANRLKNGEDIHLMHDINGTCYAVPVSETPLYGKECPSYENVLKSKKEYAVSVKN